MNFLKLFIVPLFLMSFTNLHALMDFKFDPKVSEERVKKENIERHLENLLHALVEEKMVMLAQMDEDRLDLEEYDVVKEFVQGKMTKTEKVGLIAMLKERKNVYALKQIQDILEGK